MLETINSHLKLNFYYFVQSKPYNNGENDGEKKSTLNICLMSRFLFTSCKLLNVSEISDLAAYAYSYFVLQKSYANKPIF